MACCNDSEIVEILLVGLPKNNTPRRAQPRGLGWQPHHEIQGLVRLPTIPRIMRFDAEVQQSGLQLMLYFYLSLGVLPPIIFWKVTPSRSF